MPNAIDVRQTIELFATFEDNPVVVTTVGCLCVAYVLVVIWARRKDAQDQAKVRLHGLQEWEEGSGGVPLQELQGMELRWGAKGPAAKPGHPRQASFSASLYIKCPFSSNCQEDYSTDHLLRIY